MKASIITLHSVQNYGTQLQAYATQEKLKQYFDEVEFINFIRDDTFGRGLTKLYSKGNPIKWLVIKPTIMKWGRVFSNFQKNFLNITKQKYFNVEDFEKHPISCDALIAGSDQIWNTGWNKGIIEPFYLNFKTDTMKFSFSSSFGKEAISEKESKEVLKRLKSFSAISVREESGKRIVESMGLNATRILDPTLLFDRAFWRKHAPKRKIKNDYILVYCLNKNKEFDKYCRELSKRTGLPLYRFCTRYDQIVRNGKSLLIPDIFDFISYIDNAKYVVTDSFHATAFSVNMNTVPVVFFPEKYSSRLSNFLKLVKLEECHPLSFRDYSITEKTVNFDYSNEVLEKERKKADKFLKSIIDAVKMREK